ncbi:enoyl-CoA hydratase/isomerase family protein [Sorangium sp. So ce260]|uniref:enoyl-CoA hydratase/isomerase family protein n=1 Tax=Sorangium sp. So ce260 TaxID=3133291 RepID=UPI003F6093A5
MQFVEVLTRDGIADVTLSRPKVNAMNQAVLRQLADVFQRLAEDDAARGVLVRGAGNCLSAGLDLREVASLDREGLGSFLDDFDAAFGAAFRFPKPLAAAVHGHAIAGGLLLAMCADFLALGAGDYKVGLPELAVGIAFPRVAFEIARTASPARALRRLVFGAEIHSPASLFDMGVGDACPGIWGERDDGSHPLGRHGPNPGPAVKPRAWGARRDRSVASGGRGRLARQHPEPRRRPRG